MAGGSAFFYIDDLHQHRGKGGSAKHQASGEQAVEHQGFEFHGDSP